MQPILSIVLASLLSAVHCWEMGWGWKVMAAGIAGSLLQTEHRGIAEPAVDVHLLSPRRWRKWTHSSDCFAEYPGSGSRGKADLTVAATLTLRHPTQPVRSRSNTSLRNSTSWSVLARGRSGLHSPSLSVRDWTCLSIVCVNGILTASHTPCISHCLVGSPYRHSHPSLNLLNQKTNFLSLFKLE